MPYVPHRVFQDPEPGTCLWRYMDLSKFESLLKRRALFFCRADRFADPFEGASPERDVEYRIQAYREVFEAVGKPFDEELARQNAADLAALQRALRQSVIMSCWHANRHESDAMWRLYLKDWFGVAVQSSPERLKASLSKTHYEVHAGRVRYLDYNADIYHDPEEFPIDGYNVMSPFVHKRRYFVHENEYRALIHLPVSNGKVAYDWSEDENSNGKFIDVDLPTLVERIIVPPQADDTFLTSIRELARDAGLSIDVDRSEMSRDPRF